MPGNISPDLAGTSGTHWDALGHWDKGQALGPGESAA